MQYNRLQNYRLAVWGLLFVSLAIWSVGCTKSPGEIPPDNTKTTPVSTPIAPEVKIEEKLLKDQMEVYNKLSDYYEKAPTAGQRVQHLTEISTLKARLDELSKQFNALPAEARASAQEALKEPWTSTLNRWHTAQGKKV